VIFVIILFPYDTEDLDTLARVKVQSGLATPVLKNYEYIPLNVRDIPVRKRQRVLREYIDKTDFFALVSGTYTFMRPWCHNAMVYAFLKNRPLMDVDTALIRDGWDNELVEGPNPFAEVRWSIKGQSIELFTLDPVLEVVWRKKASIPRKSVRYRLSGKTGYLDKVGPRYEWTKDRADRNFPKWVRKSIWLAGL
jgi:hypothetical protein